MNENNFLHWLPIEESRYSTTFEGSLHSKMSHFNLVYDIKDGLKAERDNTRIYPVKGASASLEEEMMKQSRIAIFWIYFFAQFDSNILNIIAGEK